MDDNTIFSRNIGALRKRNPELAGILVTVPSSHRYCGVRISRTGDSVPVYEGDIAANSLYDPRKESARLLDALAPDSFVFFCGAGGCFQVAEYLSRNPLGECILAEPGAGHLRSLLELLDISEILGSRRVTVIVDCSPASIAGILPRAYLPALHGDFRLQVLRSWENRFGDELAGIQAAVLEALESVSADYSVQAHFGRIWFRNCICNLQTAGNSQGFLPRFDLKKTAVITAAGPGLEDSLDELRKNRDRFVILCVDTAWGPLHDSGIIPDLLVSIDAQAVSANHFMHPPGSGTSVVLDLCGNPEIARQAIRSRANLILAAGGHPFARYASASGGLPVMDTGSGTFTVSALDIARSIGFTEIRMAGADFSYRNGKPYARGTYLEDLYGKVASRIAPRETAYTALMFRTPVRRTVQDSRISYSTEVLERYARSFREYRQQGFWKPGQFARFPFDEFMQRYRSDLSCLLDDPCPEGPVFTSILPLLAWYSARNGHAESQKPVRNTIQLALDLIAGYTSVS